jgi:hypothetical protein
MSHILFCHVHQDGSRRKVVSPWPGQNPAPKFARWREATRTAVSVMIRIMRSKDATPAARVSAANAMLDRGWGKATQPLENGDAGALMLIHRIERIIVHPENSDS